MNYLLRYEKMHNFIQERIQKDIYPEPPSSLHIKITKEMIDKLKNLIDLKDKKILDCGCGQGIALEIFRNSGAVPVGITFGEDFQICKSKGFEVYEMDQSFLEFQKNSFDIIWCRHALEHSLFPFFTLRGFYEVLKENGILYIEVPAPDTSAHHETNRNHYSCFTRNAWLSLFDRSGYSVIEQADITFKIIAGDDQYYCFFLNKKSK